jgi:hypothetical protein
MNLSINQKLTLGALTTSFIVGTGFFVGSYASSSEMRKKVQHKEIYDQQSVIYEKDLVIKEMLSYLDSLKNGKQKINLNSIDNDSKKCMAITLFWEAGNHGTNKDIIRTDMYLISSNITYRSKNRGLSICEVTYQKTSNGSWEYSWRGDKNKPNSESVAKKTNPKKWVYAVEMTDLILSGQLDYVDNLEGYNNLYASDNSWHMDMVRKGEFFVAYTVGINKKGNKEFHQFYSVKGKTNSIKQALDVAILNKMKGAMKDE